MRFERWLQSVMGGLVSFLKFLGIWAILSVAFSIAFTLLLLKLMVNPHDSDLGRTASALPPLLLGPIVGMTFALLVMYVFESRSQNRIKS